MGYFKSQVAEIADSIELRVFGAGLGLSYLVNAVYWFRLRTTSLLLSQNKHPICWPSMPFCQELRILDPYQMRVLGLTFTVLSLICAALFCFRRCVGVAYWLLMIVSFVKVFLYLQDFGFMGNYHYMPMFLSALFLFVPDKSLSARISTVLFYVSAGFLKLNVEWLSGLAIPDSWIRPHTPASWAVDHGFFPALCTYAVIMELILSWGLLAEAGGLFWACFVQIAAFHVFSYFIVGAYYPLTMACLLVIFPAHRLMGTRDDTRFSGPWLGLKDARPAYGAAILLGLLQLIPRLSPGDPAISGQGRAFALNMFDALSVCEAKTLVRYKSYIVEASTESRDVYRNVRKHCDPYVFFEKAKDICRSEKDDPGFLAVSLSMESRRTSASEFREIVSIDNVCDDKYKYSIFGFNPWLKP